MVFLKSIKSLKPFWCSLGIFTCLLLFIIFIFKVNFSQKELQEPTISKQYVKARNAYQRNQYTKAITLLKEVYESNLKEDDRPRALFLLAQSYRKLADSLNEYGNTEDYLSPSVPEYTAISEYLERAINYYQKLLDEFPNHFLTDDALGWIGGCWYKKGLYIKALEVYLDLLRRYPSGDQVAAGETSIHWCFKKIMKNWKDISKERHIVFFQLLRQKTAADIKWKFPQDSWKMFTQAEAQQFMQLLDLQNKRQDFLWSAGFSNTVAHIYPVEEGLNWWLFDFLEHSFYNGQFNLAFQISQLIIGQAELEKKFAAESYYWGSSLIANGVQETLELCLANNIHNGIVALAFDWLSIDDLEILAQEGICKKPELYEVLNFVLGMRYFALKDYESALDTFILIVRNDSTTVYDSLAWQKIIEIEYFFDVPNQYFLGVSSYETFKGFLGDSSFRDDLISLERIFWGQEFLENNKLLLHEIYKEYAAFEQMIFRDKQRKSSWLETKKLQKNFLNFAISSVAKIRNAPYFENVPEPSKMAMEGVLQISIKRKKFDFYGRRDKYSRQKSIFKHALIPYIDQWNVTNKKEFKKQILPLIAILWNLSNIGEVPNSDNDRLAHYDYERGTYYLADEVFFRKHIPVYNHSWTAHVIDLVYHQQGKERLMFLQGYNYVLAKEYYLSCLHRAENSEIIKKAIYMSGKAHELYARTLGNANSRWLDTLDIFGRYVGFNKGYSKLSNYPATKWAENGVSIPFYTKWQEEIVQAIAQYNLFISLFPNDKLTDDVYYNLGNLYKIQEEYDLAKESYQQAVERKGDYQKAAKEGLKKIRANVGAVNKQDALLSQIWLDFFWNKYAIVIKTFMEYRNEGYLFKGEDFNLIYALGMSNFNVGNDSEALQFFMQYIVGQPDGKYIASILSLIPDLQMRNEEAVKIIQLMDNYIDDQNRWLHMSLYKIAKASCLEKQRDYRNAKIIYQDLSNDLQNFVNGPLVLYALMRLNFIQNKISANDIFIQEFNRNKNVKILYQNNLTSLEDMLLKLTGQEIN